MNRHTLFLAAGALAAPLTLSAQGGFGSMQERTAQGGYTWSSPSVGQQFLDPQNNWFFVSTANSNKLEGQSGPVYGHPISADEVRTTTQTLGDGSHITHSETEKFYRDGQGRMRTETEASVLIFDPVAGVTYNLDKSHKSYTKSTNGANSTVTIAAAGGRGGGGGRGGRGGGGGGGAAESTSTRTSVSTTTNSSSVPVTAGSGGSFGAVQVRPTIVAVPSVAQGGQGSKETLPDQMFSGIAGKGSRVTITIPVGSIGNDRELKVVNERWYSDDFKLLLKTSNSDPRFGTSTYELQNIQQGEPAGSIFQPPADYTERR